MLIIPIKCNDIQLNALQIFTILNKYMYIALYPFDIKMMQRTVTKAT